MWLLHETHSLRGESEDAFDALLRDAWIPRVAETQGARVSYVLLHDKFELAYPVTPPPRRGRSAG